MGNGATKEFNKIFGPGGAADEDGGGPSAGTEPEDNPGSAAAGGGPPGTENRNPNDTGYGPPPPPPTMPKYNAPAFYAPRQSQLQAAVGDPESTSHNYLQRFGVPSHY